MPKIDLLCIIILICTIRRLGHRNRQSFHAAQASIRQPVGCRQTSNGSWADKQWVVGRQAMGCEIGTKGVCLRKHKTSLRDSLQSPPARLPPSLVFRPAESRQEVQKTPIPSKKMGLMGPMRPMGPISPISPMRPMGPMSPMGPIRPIHNFLPHLLANVKEKSYLCKQIKP